MTLKSHIKYLQNTSVKESVIGDFNCLNFGFTSRRDHPFYLMVLPPLSFTPLP